MLRGVGLLGDEGEEKEGEEWGRVYIAWGMVIVGETGEKGSGR